METTNKRLQHILSQKGIGVTHIVRHVYVLENPQGQLLLVHKTDHVGSVGVNFEDYLGWQLMSDCYWGCDLWDEDILVMASQIIIEKTSLEVEANNIRWIDASMFNTQGRDVLHLVYYVKLASVERFEYWYEWDDEIRWTDKTAAIEQVAFLEDKRIIQMLLDESLSDV